MMRAAAMALLLAGCAPVVPAPVAASDGCGTAAVAGVVGQTLTPAVQADIQRRTGARTVRVIRPDTVVTMDYRTDRLNVDVDADGVVRAVRCG